MTINTPSSTTAPLTRTSESISVGIIGLGSIGCLIASQFPQSTKLFALLRHNMSQEVSHTMSGKSTHNQINKTPVNFEFKLEKESKTTSISLPRWEKNSACLDVVIVCCKASQTLTALSQWTSAIGDKTQIVILQNGLGQHDQVHHRFPHHTVFAASTTEGANRKGPQDIRHAGRGVTQWGYYAGPKHTLKLDLTQLDSEHSYNDNISQVLLEKLAINAVINPLTVKYNCSNGELLTNKIAFEDLKRLCDEIENALKTLKLSLSFSLVDRARKIADLTQNNISSMLQDVRNQQETEIDFINNYLISKANEIGLSLPFNQALVDLIKEKSL